MAELAIAALMPHIIMSPRGVEDQAERVFTGMKTIGDQVWRTKPDLLLIISNDHLFNLEPEAVALFQVGIAQQYRPCGDMDIPRDPPFPGQVDFAEGLLAFAEGQGIDVKPLEAADPDHGFAVPLLFTNPRRTIPFVPIYVNYQGDPVPSPGTCWAFGEVIGRYIREERPASERVALVGTGGLSHWIGHDGRGINQDFDRAFLADISAGKLDRWLAMSVEEIEAEAGNGGLEISNWLMTVAAAGLTPGGFSFYEGMEAWMTGMAGLVLQEP